MGVPSHLPSDLPVNSRTAVDRRYTTVEKSNTPLGVLILFFYYRKSVYYFVVNGYRGAVGAGRPCRSHQASRQYSR